MPHHNTHSTTRAADDGNPVSPKATAAAVGAMVAAPLAGWLLDTVGVQVNVEALAVVIGDVLLGGAAFAAAYAKTDPTRTVTKRR